MKLSPCRKTIPLHLLPFVAILLRRVYVDMASSVTSRTTLSSNRLDHLHKTSLASAGKTPGHALMVIDALTDIDHQRW